MEPEPVLPAYGSGCVSDLVPALLGAPADRPAWMPGAARDADRCVLLVLDGLGWLQLERRWHLAPAMAAMERACITSVAPTTTATALTSITTGSPPATHRLVGYRMIVDGPEGGPEVINALRWRTASGDARTFVDPLGFVPVDPFAGRSVPVVSRREFDGTGFSIAHLRGSRPAGWSLPSSMAVRLRGLAATGEPFAYAYYEGVDKVAHGSGFGEDYDAELVATDRLVGDILDALPPEVSLVITADHGQVQVDDRTELLDEGVLAATALVSGEARFRWLRARPGRAAQLRDLAATRYGHQAWVRHVDEVEAEGWLGGPLDDGLRARLGDVAVVPWEPVAYMAAGDGDVRLACRHGSLTDEEVLVPLLAAPGREGGSVRPAGV